MIGYAEGLCWATILLTILSRSILTQNFQTPKPVAQETRFELVGRFRPPVFKTGALSRSAIPAYMENKFFILRLFRRCRLCHRTSHCLIAAIRTILFLNRRDTPVRLH